jgi:hypothetical protein
MMVSVDVRANERYRDGNKKKLSPFEEARQAFLTPDGTPRGLVTGVYALKVIEKIKRRQDEK